MKKLFYFGLIAGLVFVFAEASRAQTVSGSFNKSTVTKSSTVRANVVLDIPAGLHVNSNSPRSKYAIPTVVTVTASGVKLGGVRYPPGKNKKFSFSEETINIYEGRVVFGFNVTVPKGFKGKTVRVRAAVRYQACTDEVCYAPKTKDIFITANVR